MCQELSKRGIKTNKLIKTHNSPERKILSNLHFKDEETEEQRSETTFPRSQC